MTEKTYRLYPYRWVALAVFLVVSIAYGFATAAMLVPAVCEFDIAMGRTKTAGDE